MDISWTFHGHFCWDLCDFSPAEMMNSMKVKLMEGLIKQLRDHWVDRC